MRFYWLAFQGVDDETVWQVYSKSLLGDDFGGLIFEF